MEIINSYLFWSSSRFNLNNYMRKITVKNEIRRQRWIKNSRNLDPRLFCKWSKSLLNIFLSVIMVSNEISSLGFLKNKGILYPWIFQLSSKLLLNIVLSVIPVNKDIRRQECIDISGNLNPRLFDNLNFLSEIGSQPGRLRQIPCLFLHLCCEGSLVNFL